MGLFGREDEDYEQRAHAYGEWLRARNPYAVASLVLGIFSLIELGALIVFGIAGIVLGVVALSQLRQAAGSVREQGQAARGHILAWWGIFTSALSLILAAILYLRAFG